MFTYNKPLEGDSTMLAVNLSPVRMFAIIAACSFARPAPSALTLYFAVFLILLLQFHTYY